MFEYKLLDLENLEVGKIYPSFDGGKFSPSRLCFVEIKEKTDKGYIVDVEWGKEIVVRDQEMILKDHFYYDKPVLKSSGEYGGMITPGIYEMVDTLWMRGYLEEDEIYPSVLDNNI